MANAVRKQVVGYVPEEMKGELDRMKRAHRRLSESQLVEEALAIALPRLRELHPCFEEPTQESPSPQAV